MEQLRTTASKHQAETLFGLIKNVRDKGSFSRSNYLSVEIDNGTLMLAKMTRELIRKNKLFCG